jgi:hypothetical protein
MSAITIHFTSRGPHLTIDQAVVSEDICSTAQFVAWDWVGTAIRSRTTETTTWENAEIATFPLIEDDGEVLDDVNGHAFGCEYRSVFWGKEVLNAW